MKILASSNNGKYIGGNLFDIESHYDEYTEEQYDEIRENFAEEQIQYVQNFSDNYIVYRAQSQNMISLNCVLMITYFLIFGKVWH
jgi:hypothetical protein